MRSEQRLFLHEEITLLALRDRQGTLTDGARYPYAVGAAVMAELLLSGRVRIEEPKKGRKLVTLVEAGPLGDPLIDECLGKVQAATRRADMKSWVSRWAGTKRLQHRVAEQLCRHRILKADEDKVLLIFTRRIYPEIDPRPEKQLIERLRVAIFTDARDLDPRTVVLVSLAHHAGFLRGAFPAAELKRRKERIQRIIAGELAGQAAKAAIEAMEAAVVVAAILPAVIAATSSS